MRTFLCLVALPLLACGNGVISVTKVSLLATLTLDAATFYDEDVMQARLNEGTPLTTLSGSRFESPEKFPLTPDGMLVADCGIPQVLWQVDVTVQLPADVLRAPTRLTYVFPESRSDSVDRLTFLTIFGGSNTLTLDPDGTTTGSLSVQYEIEEPIGSGLVTETRKVSTASVEMQLEHDDCSTGIPIY